MKFPVLDYFLTHKTKKNVLHSYVNGMLDVKK